MKVISLLLLAMLLTNNSHQQCLSLNDGKIHNRTSGWDVYQGQPGFSLDLLQATAKLIAHENILISPYSIYKALVTTYLLSGGRTENYIGKILRLDATESKIDVYNGYKLDKDERPMIFKVWKHEFININKIYISDRIAVRDCIPSYFPQELYKFPFASHPDVVRSAINKWADNFTHHMIQELLPPSTRDSNPGLLLVNAAYFTGDWQYKFDSQETEQKMFYVNSSKQIMVDMMHVRKTFGHYISEDLDAHILELPYLDSFSMYILLPLSDKEDAIANILKDLTLNRFRSFVDRGEILRRRTVRVSLPKFSLKQTIDLQPILESLGVGNLFKSDADLTKLSDSIQHISVDEAIHKARIDVNEEGLYEAPDKSYIPRVMMEDEYGGPVHVKCNRPFIFFIFNKSTKTTDFAGIYRHPDTVK